MASGRGVLAPSMQFREMFSLSMICDDECRYSASQLTSPSSACLLSCHPCLSAENDDDDDSVGMLSQPW